MAFINTIMIKGIEYNICDGTLFPTFNDTKIYYIGDIVSNPKNGKPYKFSTTHNGTWSDDDVTEVIPTDLDGINKFVVIDKSNENDYTYEKIKAYYNRNKNIFIRETNVENNIVYLYQLSYKDKNDLFYFYTVIMQTIDDNAKVYPICKYIILGSDNENDGTIVLARNDHSHNIFKASYDESDLSLPIPNTVFVGK